VSVKLPLAVLAAVLLAANSAEGAHHWSYSGAQGPAHWEGTCASGKDQSPIDIHPAAVKHERLASLAFAYKPGALHIVDNGHSVQVDVDPGSTLAVDGVRYSLVQFHFHRPSEEAIDGHRFPMVVHLVHRDAKGELAVVSVPLEEGAANPLVATLWQNLPHDKEHRVSPAKVTIDPARLLPANLGYFAFSGSLTTPPCTEGVRWLVLQHPVTVSHDEVAAFATLYPDNARPLQPLNGRRIAASN
jgi:carbonic anhydrase